MEEYAVNITNNFRVIQTKIASAQSRSTYRQPVKLVAVTKTKPVNLLEEAYALGLREFGENRVQELLTKKPNLPQDINWHLIGPLQTNKVKAVLDHATLIHSLDREALAEEIEKRAEEKSLKPKVLVEVNVAQEENKHGLLTTEIKDFLAYLTTKKHLSVLGLMTVAPYADNPEEIRWVFQELHKIYIDLKKFAYPNVSMEVLSMGMTNDFEIAIEEGANLVRIGSGIFGNR